LFLQGDNKRIVALDLLQRLIRSKVCGPAAMHIVMSWMAGEHDQQTPAAC
jgi:hypothetical protein